MEYCIIILFSANDEETGEMPVAFVVRKVGSVLSEEAILDFVAQQVLPHNTNLPYISIHICNLNQCPSVHASAFHNELRVCLV